MPPKSHIRPFWSLVSMLGIVGAAGCATTSGDARVPGRPDEVREGVEVWNEREPSRDFVPTGDLSARSASRPTTIAKLQKEAGRLYMSGIYQVECSGPRSGACTATGFVYRNASMGGQPEVARR